MTVTTTYGPRGEERHETGTGTVLDVDQSRRNWHVSIDAEHLRHPVKGWVDPTELGDAAALLEPGAYVDYVVAVRRRRGYDPTVPLDAVDKDDRLRELIALTPGGTSPQNAPAAAPAPIPHPDPDRPAQPAPSRQSGEPAAIVAAAVTLAAARDWPAGRARRLTERLTELTAAYHHPAAAEVVAGLALDGPHPDDKGAAAWLAELDTLTARYLADWT